MEFQFSREESAELYYIEGLEQLTVALSKIAGRIYGDDAARISSSLSDLNVKSLISLKFVFLARKIKLNDINMLSVKRTSSPTDC